MTVITTRLTVSPTARCPSRRRRPPADTTPPSRWPTAHLASRFTLEGFPTHDIGWTTASRSAGRSVRRRWPLSRFSSTPTSWCTRAESGRPCTRERPSVCAARAGGGGSLWFSRQILREYLAVVTRPQPTEPALSLAAAVAMRKLSRQAQRRGGRASSDRGSAAAPHATFVRREASVRCKHRRHHARARRDAVADFQRGRFPAFR